MEGLVPFFGFSLVGLLRRDGNSMKDMVAEGNSFLCKRETLLCISIAMVFRCNLPLWLDRRWKTEDVAG